MAHTRAQLLFQLSVAYSLAIMLFGFAVALIYRSLAAFVVLAPLGPVGLIVVSFTLRTKGRADPRKHS